MKRRSLLKAAAGSVVLSAAPGVAFGSAGAGRRVYVVVLDGLRPDEVGTALTPNLVALREDGTHFPRARSLPAVASIPDHVVMMTGVRPDRTGVPANTVFDRATGVVRTPDHTDLRFPTLLERLPQLGFRTGSVLSKEYLRGVFGTRASYHWEPRPPITGHTPDAFTSHALHAMIAEADPDLVFVSFGDCAEDSGDAVVRSLAVRTSDEQLGKLVRYLKATGRWERSVLVVVTDHPAPLADVSLQQHVDADPLLRNKVVIAPNGGADLLHWTGPASDRELALRHLESVVSRVPGVLSVQPPARWRLGAEAGDLVVCRRAAEPVPLLVAGGDPVVGRGISATPASTVDVAPTVGRLFGLPEPSGGYDGQSVI
ncbi:alkaline phosphatase family protein [Lentzea guizhouensis]|uniref:alkaline phosphatase family protein n=1 Tax=Lentzea guizhouensis TaxID=1586287 RepID=UPI0009F687FB|nr:alkaline phosphatase family protein [Lentzea guizhouensis]